MDITLDTVRQTLRQSFGRDSFVASFISRVEATNQCGTACINAEGVLQYDPSFVDKYVTMPEDLFCLIAHELMHPLFGHFIYDSGELENIAADTVINAVLSILYRKHSGSGSLFRKFYKPEGLQGLLRPNSNMNQSRYNQLYNAFYADCAPHPKFSTGEVIQTLKVLTPVYESREIVLLGGHPNTQAKACPRIPQDIVASIASDFQRAAALPSGCAPGCGDALFRCFMSILKSSQTIKRQILQRFLTQRKVDRFKQPIQRPRLTVSPIPIRPSKRDLVLLAAGMPPFHYHNQIPKVEHAERGLAIYLDVSGSVNQHLPHIIALLRSLSNHLNSIFLFSNKVVEVPFETLLHGRIDTTFGTDFDCIAQHILERRHDKAVILTDGHASMTKQNQEQLRAKNVQTLTVLFGGKNDCREFGSLGDTARLEDITT